MGLTSALCWRVDLSVRVSGQCRCHLGALSWGSIFLAFGLFFCRMGWGSSVSARTDALGLFVFASSDFSRDENQANDREVEKPVHHYGSKYLKTRKCQGCARSPRENVMT